MKLDKKILGIFLGLGLISTFVVVASANDNTKFDVCKKEIENIKENKKDSGGYEDSNSIKPNNNDYGEGILVAINVDNILSNGENKTTEKDLLNFDMVISKVLYDNGLLTDEIIDQLLEEFKDANNLKLYDENILTIRGEENFKKLQDVIAKTDFKNVELTREFFDQTIRRIKEVLLKEKNKVDVLYSEIKKAFENNDEKALLECQNMREIYFILEQEDRIKKYKLSGQELEKAEGLIKHIKEAMEKQTKEGKLSDDNKGLLLKIRDDYGKRYIPKLDKCIEKINEIKFEDVKDLHKNLDINKNVKLLKGIVKKEEKN